MKINSFGVFCRKLRLDHRELLHDMAKKLGVSSAFLSKVENGKAKPPADWRLKIISMYDLDDSAIKELDIALYEAQNSNSIDMSNFSADDKALMWTFARKLNSLDKEELKKFLNEGE